MYRGTTNRRLAAFYTGYVGDGLTVLGRERQRVRSALVSTAILCGALCFAISLVTVLAFHLGNLQLALLYATMVVVWMAEETGRRVLMSRLEFWGLVVNDATYVGVTLLSLTIALVAGAAVTLGLIVGCMAIGAFTAVVLARVQLPAAEYRGLRPSTGALVEVGHFGLWRSLQASLRQLQQLLPQLLVKVVDGSDAVGGLNYGRLVVAPVQTALGAAASLLLATGAADERADEGNHRLNQKISMVLIAATVACGAVASVFSNPLGRLLTKHPVSHLLVLGWAIYLVMWAASLPFTAELTVRQLTRPVFVARLVETVADVALMGGALLGGASSAVMPWLLALPALVNVGYVRRMAIRSRPVPGQFAVAALADAEQTLVLPRAAVMFDDTPTVRIPRLPSSVVIADPPTRAPASGSGGGSSSGSGPAPRVWPAVEPMPDAH
jgi:hypothetical protein